MKVIKLVCPNCKANLELDDSREFGFCQYCGTKILLEKEQPNIVINNVIVNNTNVNITNNKTIINGTEIEESDINQSDNFSIIETDPEKNIMGCFLDIIVIGFVLFFGIAMKWIESPIYWISVIVILIIIKVIQVIKKMRNK